MNENQSRDDGYEDEDDYEFFLEDEPMGEDGPNTFIYGADLMVETDCGIEVGEFMGVSDQGLMFRATHKTNVDTGETIELGRTVLTFIPWRRIERIELMDELVEDNEVRKFRKTVPDGVEAGGEGVVPNAEA